jgi:hypothetical protein
VKPTQPRWPTSALDATSGRRPPAIAARRTRRRAANRRGFALAAFSALGLLLALAPASALALSHGFTGSFGSGTSTAANPYPLSSPSGVAVNEVSSGNIGDVYVVDAGHNRVEQFSSAGAFVLMFGKEVNETEHDRVGLKSGETLAQKEAKENVCTAASGNACQEGTAGAGPGEFSSPQDIAIDNSGSAGDPSDGDVYVVNTAGDDTVAKFTPAGAYLGELSETEAGSPFGALDGVAVSPGGDVWIFQEDKQLDEFDDALTNSYLAPAVADPRGTNPGLAVDSEGNFYVNTGGGSPAKLNGAGKQIIEEVGSDSMTGIAVNLDALSSEFDDVYVDNATSVAAYTKAPGCTAITPCGDSASGSLIARFGVGSLQAGTGIAVDGDTGVLYVADASGNDVAVFGLGSSPSTPLTEPASEETSTSATLNGTLTSGSEHVTYAFLYKKGESCTEGNSSPTPAAEADSSSKEFTSVSGLEPSTTYTFCLQATNPFGSTQGAPEPFETKGVPPTAETGGVSELTSGGATLNGEVDPFNQETSYSFEYSTNPSLEDATTITGMSKVPPHLSGEQAVSVATGPVLAPETAYYYRVLAQNETLPVATGTVRSFTTAPPLPTVTTEGASQITAASASLAGSVLPGSSGPNSDAKWHFQYGTSNAYGQQAPDEPGDVGMGFNPIPVATTLSGLVSNTTYHYRLLASNVNHDPGVSPQLAYGADRTFTTAPLQPFAGESAHLSETGATLSGDVDPDGHALEYRFEYGPSTAYGQSTPVSSAAETEEYTTVSASVASLIPGIAYHYRVVAIGPGGETYSSDATFTLYPPAPAQTGNPFTPGQVAPAAFGTFPPLGTPTVPPRPTETVTPPKSQTKAQKLATALKACRTDKDRKKRVACEKRAHRKYGTKAKANKSAKRGGQS